MPPRQAGPNRSASGPLLGTRGVADTFRAHLAASRPRVSPSEIEEELRRIAASRASELHHRYERHHERLGDVADLRPILEELPSRAGRQVLVLGCATIETDTERVILNTLVDGSTVREASAEVGRMPRWGRGLMRLRGEGRIVAYALVARAGMLVRAIRHVDRELAVVEDAPSWRIEDGELVPIDEERYEHLLARIRSK